MAGNYYICNEYIAYNLQSPWNITSYTGLVISQMQEPPNLIAISNLYSTGKLEVQPFEVTLNRNISSIDMIWNQWNCGPIQPNLIYTFYMSINGGATWIASNPITRTTGNGSKVRLTNVLVGPLTTIMVKFTIDMNRNGGYSPTTEDDVSIYFNTDIKNTIQSPDPFKAKGTHYIPFVTAGSNNNATVSAEKMSASGAMLPINPMTNWDGTSANITASLMSAKTRTFAATEVIATGSLTGIVEPLSFKAAAALPLPFVKDQETVEINLDPLVIRKEIELEVSLYDL